MKTYKIKGVDYVKKSDLDAIPEWEIVTKSVMTEATQVMGIGAVRVGRNNHTVRLSLKYIEKLVKALKAMSSIKDDFEAVDIVWTKDKPVIIGRLDDDGMATGFLIAPRVDN